MRRLALVRHSVPEIEVNRSASSWKLSETGRRRAELLAARLSELGLATIWSSKETKAVETAEIVAGGFGVPVQIVDGLEEHHRSGVPIFPTQREFEAAVEGFFRAPDKLVFGKETANEALARFSAAIERLVEAEEGDIVVVAHGTVMSLYAARSGGGSPVELWRRLGLPSLVVMTLPDRRIQSVVETVSDG